MTTELERYPFIFSDSRPARIKRHLVFWGAWWLFQTFIYSFVAFARQEAYFTRLISSSLEALVYLIPHMFLGFSLMYFLLPRYIFKARYWAAVVWIAVLFLMTALISGILSLTVIELIHQLVYGYDLIKKHEPVAFKEPAIIYGRLYLSLMSGLRGGLTIGGLAAAIKLMKYWYQKEQRNLQLQHEKSEAQLQLLKAQIHPHFFFNTLNNIYSLTQELSKPASELVMGLSNILRYMLYETNQPMVSLEKELHMITQYVSLENVRYGNKLDAHVLVSGPVEQYIIAPLLLIPFVENAYKHGCSQVIENPWLSLEVHVENDGVLQMNLMNSKPASTVQKKPNGIGIGNVQKRLELLYPNMHQLEIIVEDELYIVNLVIQLKKKQMEENVLKKPKEVAYAFA